MLSCPRGGFHSIRHNEIRNLTTTLLTEVCSSVTIEPDLQVLTTEEFSIEQQTSLKVQDLTSLPMVSGEGDLKKTFLDVRVFNPFAPSNRNATIDRCYRRHEMDKKHAYEQHIREVEHASFTPLVMSATGGLAKEATNFYKDWLHVLLINGTNHITAL